MRTAEALQVLAEHRGEAIVVSAMSAAYEWAPISDHPLDLVYLPSAMAHAPGIALGLALARPGRRVVALNGDGCMLMSLGSLVTIAEADAANLVLIVLDNGIYAITGAQSVPGRGRTDFPAMARAAGFAHVAAFDDATAFDRELPHLLSAPGPAFVNLSVESQAPGPPPSLAPMPERIARLRAELARGSSR
jgi:thiamine pyrophosphate-dependent acetolactate synthase large subunit-like protein